MKRARTVLKFAIILALVAPALAGDDKKAPPRDPRAAGKAVVVDTGMLGTNDGAQIYQQICQGCHMPEGRGAEGAGHYPAFAKNPNLASAPYMVVTILNGRRNMPAFRQPSGNENFFPPVYLTDVQVAAVVNYIRGSFGNHYKDAISADDVSKLKPKS
jgi:mono/diheme cytochrome c family protein